MQTENYKKRSLSIRQSARAHLLSIRRERLASKTSASLAQAMVQAVADHSEPMDDVALNTAPSVPEPDPPHHDLSQHDPLSDALNDVAVQNAAMAEMEDEACVADPAPAVDEPMLSHVEDPDPIETELSDEAEDMVGDQDAPEVALSQDADQAGDTVENPPEPDWTESDLSKLPGAGPGLVWMLNQCGIFSLPELAREDVAGLTSKLGVVGDIIDVSIWITFASEHASGEA